MKNLLEVSRLEGERLIDIVCDIKSLSDSFFRTGNTYMGDKLMCMAEEIKRFTENIQKAIEEALNGSVKEAQQSSLDVI